MVDLIEPSEILVDPIELMELCPVERPKVDLNDSTPNIPVISVKTIYLCPISQKEVILPQQKTTSKIFVPFGAANIFSRLHLEAAG